MTNQTRTYSVFQDIAARASRRRPGSVEPMWEGNAAEQSVARLDLLARVMDSAVRIPGTTVTIGADALLGLLPGLGDAISAGISSYLIWEAKKLGVSKLVLARMAGNVAIDTIVGVVPFFGDAFDVVYQANMKNIALLKDHIEKHGLRDNNGRIIDGDYTREA